MNKNPLLIILCFILSGFVSVAPAQPSQLAARQAEYVANARQRKELMRDYGLTEDQAQKIQQFSWERSQQIDATSKLNLPEPELRTKRDVVTDEYYAKIANILSPAQRARFNPAALKAAKAVEVKHLKLSREQAYKMGELKAEYDARVAAMNEQKLAGRERKGRKETLDKSIIQSSELCLGRRNSPNGLTSKTRTLSGNTKPSTVSHPSSSRNIKPLRIKKQSICWLSKRVHFPQQKKPLISKQLKKPRSIV